MVMSTATATVERIDLYQRTTDLPEDSPSASHVQIAPRSFHDVNPERLITKECDE